MRHWFSDLRAFQRDPLEFLLERGNSANEPLEPLALGPSKVFLLTDPKLVKPLLKADEEEIDKGRLIHKLRPIMGMSSLTISGDEQRRRREALHRQLARGNVERLVPIMAAEIRKLGAQLAKTREFNVHSVTAPLALKMVCVALFGTNVIPAADEQALVHTVRMVEDDIADNIFRMLPPAPWTSFKRRQERAFARRALSMIVHRIRRNAAETSTVRALEQLGLTDDQIRDEILTMLIAGHHTSGSAAAWVLYYLATEPGLMDAIAAEATIATDNNGEIRPELMKHASRSLALIREALRLYPPIWWFSREIKRPMEFGGRRLKPGTSIIVSPWQLQRDPRSWGNPDQFRLDRTYTSESYIPFGAGPRACVGFGLAMVELQLLALEFAAAYRFHSVTPNPAPRPTPFVTLIPPSISMKIELREDIGVSASAA